MAFVADAVMAAAWLLPDAQSDQADVLLKEVDAIHVPALFGLRSVTFWSWRNDVGGSAEAVLVAFLPSLAMLLIPEIGIAKNPTDPDVSRQHVPQARR